MFKKRNVASALNVDLADIQEARKELQQYLHPSPLLLNPWLSELFKCEIHLKLENMQPIGSFKIRGATYKISRLTRAQKRVGVVAASAGNHAQGVAWGARRFGVSALIVMPVGAPVVKVQNTRALGAEVIFRGHSYDESFEAAREISQKSRRILIHAFEDEAVIAGQGTIGLEVLEQLPDVDFVVGAVGGGGMMAGVSTVFKALRPQTEVIACQAASADSMVQSIQQGKAVKLKTALTFADGIAVKSASERMRKILSPKIDRWIEVDEDAIAASVLILLEKAKIVTEGSGAVVLASLSQLRKKIRGKKVVLLISGGNIDVNVLSRIIDRGLVRTGRRVRLNVLIQDRPGTLARLTGLIAKQGANILQTIHDRNEPSTRMNQSEVALTLETLGPDHSRMLVDSIRAIVDRLDIVH